MENGIINNTEEKRKYILKILENPTLIVGKEALNLGKYVGPGILNKILRLLKAPHLYLLYVMHKILNKFGFKHSKKYKKIKLYGIREISIKCDPVFTFELPLTPQEIKLTKFFVKNLKENDVFYDIGANFGFYTHLALEFCREVHSFEPLPEEFENLINNLKDGKRIFLNNLALSNTISTAKLKLANGSSSIILEIKEKVLKGYDKEIEVKTTTLDEYLKTHNPPTILKIDVEGAENLVIEGGINFFKNNSPIIAMEIWGDKSGYNLNHKKAVEILKGLGYKSYKINNNGELCLLENINFSEIPDNDNLVFKK